MRTHIEQRANIKDKNIRCPKKHSTQKNWHAPGLPYEIDFVAILLGAAPSSHGPVQTSGLQSSGKRPVNC